MRPRILLFATAACHSDDGSLPHCAELGGSGVGSAHTNRRGPDSRRRLRKLIIASIPMPAIRSLCRMVGGFSTGTTAPAATVVTRAEAWVQAFETRCGSTAIATTRSLTPSRRGAPTGMPPWGTKIPEDQIWQLVAYIKSMRTPA